MEFCTLATASAREYCAGSTRRASSVARLCSGTASNNGHCRFGWTQTTCASAAAAIDSVEGGLVDPDSLDPESLDPDSLDPDSFGPDMRATVRPPIQQAETLSGWCSRREASPTIWASVQRKRPKCTASAMPANRAAAEEPQPLPMGMSFAIRRDKGVIG